MTYLINLSNAWISLLNIKKDAKLLRKIVKQEFWRVNKQIREKSLAHTLTLKKVEKVEIMWVNKLK